MSWVSVAVVGVGFAEKEIAANKQKKQGNALINAPMPKEGIPSEITSAAAQGLPSEQYAKAQQNILRQQATAQAAAQDRRAGLGMIGKTQQATNDAMLSLDAKNAQARQQNLLRLAQYKDKQWQVNEKDPYTRNYNYGMQVLGAGNANTVSGIDTLVGGIGDAAYMGAFGGGNKYDPYADGRSAYKMSRISRYDPSING